jgi:hypothetical protein
MLASVLRPFILLHFLLVSFYLFLFCSICVILSSLLYYATNRRVVSSNLYVIEFFPQFT